MVDFPTPSGYRQSTVPPPFPTSDDTPTAQRFARKRLYFWFGLAALLHVGLLLAFFLSPKLRLKAGYSPDRWVQILPIPAEQSLPTPAAAPAEKKAPKAAASRASGTATPSPGKTKPATHQSHQVNPSAETGSTPLPAAGNSP